MQQEPMDGTSSGAVYVQTNAAPNEVIAFRRGADGSLERISSVATGGDSYAIEGGSLVVRTSSVGNGRSEICWAVLTPDDRFAFTTNFAGGGRIYGWSVDADGTLEPIGSWEGVPKTVAGIAAS